MTTAHLDAAHGVTADMLLGAMVDAGASVEAVDRAVATLGGGNVKLTWYRVPRGDRMACAVRVRAPEKTPDVFTWEQVRNVLHFAAVPDAVRDLTLAIASRLFQAEAAAAGLSVDELDMPPVGVLDAMSVILGVAASLVDLEISSLTVGSVGVGSGRVETIVGDVDLPTPAVQSLLEGFTTVSIPSSHQLTTAAAAAVLATIGTAADGPPDSASRTGLGAGSQVAGDDAVVTLSLP